MSESSRAAALLALWNDVDPALDAEYNDWHAREHVPERLTVPGMLWGLRYRRGAGAAAMPRYLTLYGLRDASVLDSAPYLRLLSEPTPASRRMRPALTQLSRWVCDLHRCIDLDRAVQLKVWTSPHEPNNLVAPPGGPLLVARRRTDARPLPWLGADQGQGIEGHWLQAAAPPAGPDHATLLERLDREA
jgi:hypothetical protein